MSVADEKRALHRFLRNARGPAVLSGHMYATAAESREQVTDFYQRVWAHSDGTIEELPLDARGTVPWWPEERRHPTLHTLLVHAIQETAWHAGHADIIRESIDGAVGLREGVSNMPPETGAAAWKQHCDKLESIARSAQPAPLTCSDDDRARQ